MDNKASDTNRRGAGASAPSGTLHQIVSKIEAWFGATPRGRREPLVQPGPAQPDRAQLLRKTRALHAMRIQHMAAEELAALQYPLQPWMTPDEPLRQIIEQQGRLVKEGRVMWAALVQANSSLFVPGPSDSAAMIVHSADTYFDDHPQELLRIADTIFALKDMPQDDADLAEASRRVTDEMSREMSEPLPRGLLARHSLMTSTILVFRMHLPARVLSHRLLPILTHPATPATLILPACFWPEELVAMWNGRQL